MSLFHGKAIIAVEGNNLLKFVEQIAFDCQIYGIKQISDKKIILTIDFNNLSNIFAKNSNKWYNITVLKTSGIMPCIKNLKKRLILCSGMAILIVGMLIFSLFVWEVEVIAKNAGDTSEVYEKLQEHGTKAKLKSRFDKKEVERYLYLNVPTLTFVNCSFSGVKLKVEVAFSIAEENLNRKENQLAERSGRVTRIVVYSGTCVVSVGDEIAVGDTLILGVIGEQKVQARGEIYVERELQSSVEIPRLKTEYFSSGNYVDKSWLSMLLFESGRRAEPPPYEKYSVTEFSYYAFPNNLIPIRVHVTRYLELVPKILESGFLENKNRYIQKAKIDVLLTVLGDYAVMHELIEIENEESLDRILMFFVIEQKA